MFFSNSHQQKQDLHMAQRIYGQGLDLQKFVYLRESTGDTYQFALHPQIMVQDLINKIYANRRQTIQNDQQCIDLRYKGQILDKSAKLGQIAGITENPIIHIVFQQRQIEKSATINRIYISHSQQLWTLHFQTLQPTVDEVQQKLQEMGLPAEQQILIFQSLLLEKGNNLDKYGIKNGDIISLGLRTPGPPHIPFFDLNKQYEQQMSAEKNRASQNIEDKAKVVYLKPRVARRNSEKKYQTSTSPSINTYTNSSSTPEPIPHRFNSKKLLKSNRNADQHEALMLFNPSDLIEAQTPNSPVNPSFNNFEGFIMTTEEEGEREVEDEERSSQNEFCDQRNIIFDEVVFEKESDKEVEQEEEDIFKVLRNHNYHQPIDYQNFSPNAQIGQDGKMKKQNEQPAARENLKNSKNSKKSDVNQGQLLFNLQSAFQKCQVVMCESANYEQMMKIQNESNKKQEVGRQEEIVEVDQYQ